MSQPWYRDWTNDDLKTAVAAVDHHGNQRDAAKSIGISQTQICFRLKEAKRRSLTTTEGVQNMTTQDIARTQTPFKKKFECAEAIKQHCKSNSDGRAEYERGWTDERVASEHGVSTAIIQNMRRDLFGRLCIKQAGKPSGKSNLAIAEIKSLHRKIDALLQNFGVSVPA